MPSAVRLVFVVASVLLVACAPPPPPVERAKPDPTEEASYAQALEQLTKMNGELDRSLRKRRPEDAAAIVTKAQPLVSLLLAAPRPHPCGD